MTALFQGHDEKMHVRYLLLCLANNILRVNKSYCYHFNCYMITIYVDCYLGHLFLLLMSILRLRNRKFFWFFSVFLGLMFSFQSILITGHVSPWERFWFRTWEPVKQLKYSEELLNEVWGRPHLIHSGKLGHPLDVIYKNWRYT